MQLELINIFDIFVAAVVVFSSVIALFRGFVFSFLSIIAWGAAIYCSNLFFMPARDYLDSVISNTLIATGITSIFIFSFFLISFSLIASFVRKMIMVVNMGVIDRVGGVIFGIFRGYIIIAVFIFVILSLSTSVANKKVSDEDILPDVVLTSASYPMLNVGVKILSRYITNDFFENFGFEIPDNLASLYDSPLKKLERILPQSNVEKMQKQKTEQYLTMSKREAELNYLKYIAALYRDKRKWLSDEDKRIGDASIVRLQADIASRHDRMMRV